MLLTKNNIYNHRFKSLKLIFVLESAYDADDIVKCLDMDTYAVVYFNAYDLWDNVVDMDELDVHYLQCPYAPKKQEQEQDEEEKRIESYAPFFSGAVERYLKSDKNMRDRDLAFIDIDAMFFGALDETIALNFNLWGYCFDDVKALRLAHARARDTIWQTGAIII